MKTFIRYLGALLVISALFRIVPIITAFVFDESQLGFWVAAGISLLLGVALILIAHYWPKDKDLGLSLSGGLTLAALSFILLPLIGALSYLPTLEYSFVDSLFESVSGFTTTGLTVYTDLDSLPRSLLIWRAMTQWIGGIGIVMVFLFILTRLRSHDYIKLSEVEERAQSAVSLYRSQGFTEKLTGGLKSSVSRVILIYLGYTLLGILLLYFSGLTLFESIGLSFTALSTGGFSMTNDFSFSGGTLGALMLLMLLGSISFLAHNKLVLGKWKEFIYSFEKNVFLVLLTFATLVTLLTHADLIVSFFMMVSAFTTTGYALGPISVLPALFIFMVTIGMLVGGSFASTSGGMKIYRIYYLFRAIPWSIKKLSSPAQAVIPFKVHDQEVDEAKLANIGIFLFAYILILAIGIIVFMIFDYSFLDSSFQMISALGTVGLQSTDILALNPLLKSLLMVAMLLGRLEIFPIFILIRNIFK
ncbi:MAG: hypothetical protein OEY44_00170 [Candidatus Peregrinibacteria bacterium]|nr:hypothetical protein [Candidatus Peregrinibacteria bacterium]